jgi:GNAT superfamily N-acetyltransferase
MNSYEYTIDKNLNFTEVLPLLVEGELEFSPDTQTIPCLYSCYGLFHGADKELTAGAAVTFEHGEYVLKGIAVKKEYRGKGFGKLLTEYIIEDLRNGGASGMYLTAKAPEFYKQFGFRIIDSKTAPPISGCLNCRRFRNTCNPEIMKLDMFPADV